MRMVLMWDDQAVITGIAIITFVVTVVFWAVYEIDRDHRLECQNAGGIYRSFKGGSVCLHPSAVIEPDRSSRDD